MTSDVVVVGGGPIGLLAARCAAERGASVLLVDRRDRPGSSSCCAGLVSPRTLSTLGASTDTVLREIRSVAVHAPNGTCVVLSDEATKAVVIDRGQLERELCAGAGAAGAKLRFGTEAIAGSPGRIVLQAKGRRYEVAAAAIVGADGPTGSVASWFELTPPDRHVRAAQAVVEADTAHPERVDVYFGADVAPGFFGWTVPAEVDRLRVGVGVAPPADPFVYLSALLAARHPHARIVDRAGGRIPLAPVPRSSHGSTLLVGDAAGQVKPLSGGGLYTGAIGARIAGRFAAEASDGGDVTGYDDAWRSAIGREIAFGRAVRRLATRIADPVLDAAVAASADPELLSFLAARADIDRFHRLPDELAAHPSLWGKVLRLLPIVLAAGEIDRSTVVSASRASL